jgi:CsoR family transcriptional regulator, copper-sensing transcriptional repressor
VAMYFSNDVKEQLQRNMISRLKKIEGQVRGLQHMIDDGKPCEQILVQVRAAQSALKSVSNLVLKSYLMKCFSDVGEEPTPEEVWAKLDETLGVLTKFSGG